ncbi:hypothetical protein [Allochromatium humboldtianum]|uniref:hypothetical protein n=1 Tax=Allochromatium humboldtianum TaxID=504901 RepID=UPI001CA3CB03|nr:hypothetical protein [Allochromatium humboldtianum]
MTARQELYAYEEQRRMPYVTTVEQAGIEKGLQQGVQQGEARTLLRLLDRRFGPEAAQRHRERIETAESPMRPCACDARQLIAAIRDALGLR